MALELNFNESSYINPPHKVDGSMKEAKISFYELAKNKIKLMNSGEYRTWFSELYGRDDSVPRGACCPFGIRTRKADGKTIEKFVENLEIGVNIDDFVIDGISYEDIMPYAIEHELYEAWLTAKKGLLGDAYKQEDLNTKHRLSLRREFYLAERDGSGQRLFEWRTKLNPKKKDEYKNAWENAKKKLSKKDKG